jgi:hypothetical protein
MRSLHSSPYSPTPSRLTHALPLPFPLLLLFSLNQEAPITEEKEEEKDEEKERPVARGRASCRCELRTPLWIQLQTSNTAGRLGGH